MKFFRRSKKKDPLLSPPAGGPRRGSNTHDEPVFRPLRNVYEPPPTLRSARLLGYLGPDVLERIFAAVCPQSLDESYETCEQSFIEDACMLCDVRDLAHCAAVCKRWRDSARTLL